MSRSQAGSPLQQKQIITEKYISVISSIVVNDIQFHINVPDSAYIPIVPFAADVRANAQNGVHTGVLDLLEEPDNVVVPLEVVLKIKGGT